MTPVSVGLITLLCTFGGALFGMWFRERLPADHVEDRSKSTIGTSIGLVATMTALVLGLVTASAKNSYDAADAAVKHSASQLVTLDRALARYGPETKEIRAELQQLVARRIAEVWPDGSKPVQPESAISAAPHLPERISHQIRTLHPGTDEQRALQSRATDLVEQILDARWAVLATTEDTVPTAFLVIMIFWLSVTFASFGLFAPRNATVVAALLLSALSVSCAIFLVLELGSPFEGLLRVSGEPMKHALQLLTR
ncbi:MAG TPA: DUF4239 domain-containing protein [Burkholderiaceae bacterium]|nr:DUF4239 domain-containing protein [Burkholderiaceae bacterium]